MQPDRIVASAIGDDRIVGQPDLAAQGRGRRARREPIGIDGVLDHGRIHAQSNERRPQVPRDGDDEIERVLGAMAGKTAFMLRASEFPPNRKNQTAQAFRKFRDEGGRSILVPIPDWERMMTVREFHTSHRNNPGFAAWVARDSRPARSGRSCDPSPAHA